MSSKSIMNDSYQYEMAFLEELKRDSWYSFPSVERVAMIRAVSLFYPTAGVNYIKESVRELFNCSFSHVDGLSGYFRDIHCRFSYIPISLQKSIKNLVSFYVRYLRSHFDSKKRFADLIGGEINE